MASTTGEDDEEAVAHVFSFSGNEDVPDDSKHIRVDSSVKELPENAFKEHFELLTVELPPTLVSLRRMALYCCTNLTTINFPSLLHEIPEDAFQSCRSLTDIVLPEMLESIGARAFFECESLTEIKCPPNLKTIGRGAFVHCRSMVSIDLPDKLQSIGDRAFVDCSSLETITMPSGVSQIKRGTFSHCHSLKTVNFAANGLEMIGDGAFWCCGSLTSIRVPSTVYLIGNSAFLYCTSLVSVVFSEGIHVIRQLAFQSCKSLVNIALPASLQDIPDNTFEDCEKLLSLFPVHDQLVHKLQHRFEGLPMHKLCYDEPGSAVEDVSAIVGNANAPHELVAKMDILGMTPFHILALASPEPSVGLMLKVLQETSKSSSVTLVDEKDRWGNCPMDYLCLNPAPNAISTARDMIKITTRNRVEQFGLMDWRMDVIDDIEKLVNGDVMSTRRDRIYRIFVKLLRYERTEALSLLELALWSTKINEARTADATLDPLFMRNCRINCGVEVLVSNVLPFLGDSVHEMSFQSSVSEES